MHILPWQWNRRNLISFLLIPLLNLIPILLLILFNIMNIPTTNTNNNNAKTQKKKKTTKVSLDAWNMKEKRDLTSLISSSSSSSISASRSKEKENNKGESRKKEYERKKRSYLFNQKETHTPQHSPLSSSISMIRLVRCEQNVHTFGGDAW